MTERQMESLIAQFPNDFFPGHELQLKGRQQSFADVGRFDLLFTDRFQTNVLMELKARPAKYEDASQLAKYKDALTEKGETNILMWLVAPQISNSVREFLDRIGIEYSEIHDAQFKRVAERHSITLDAEILALAAPPDNATAPNHSRSQLGSPNLPYGLNESFDKGKLEHLLKEFDASVRRQQDRSLSQKLRHELVETTPPHISRATLNQLAKWCNTNNPVYYDGMKVAREISRILFDCIVDRYKLGV